MALRIHCSSLLSWGSGGANGFYYRRVKKVAVACTSVCKIDVSFGNCLNTSVPQQKRDGSGAVRAPSHRDRQVIDRARG